MRVWTVDHMLINFGFQRLQVLRLTRIAVEVHGLWKCNGDISMLLHYCTVVDILQPLDNANKI